MDVGQATQGDGGGVIKYIGWVLLIWHVFCSFAFLNKIKNKTKNNGGSIFCLYIFATLNNVICSISDAMRHLKLSTSRFVTICSRYSIKLQY